MAPEGHECFYVLVPVPNNLSGINWSEEGEKMKDLIINKMENDLLQKQREIEEFQLKYFGPQGELYKMQENLLKPILAVIDEAIQNIGKEKGYDYIFDAVQGSIVYALESNNLTTDVLEELKKINS